MSVVALTEVDASLDPSGRSIFFAGWDEKEMPYCARLALPFAVSPDAFLEDEWATLAANLTWFNAIGRRVRVLAAGHDRGEAAPFHTDTAGALKNGK